MSTVGGPLEQALASADAQPDGVLNLVDAAIEHAAATGDGATLDRLAQRLDAVASQRGGEWRALAIAAARARALAGLAGVPPVVPEAEVPPAIAAGPQFVYAGWWRRVFAFLLDWIALGVAYSMLGSIESGGPLGLVSLMLPFAYFAGLPALVDGVTLGKAALGIAVRVDDGTRIGFGRALGRAISLFVLWVTVVGAVVDVILAGADSRRQSVHDKMAGTIVVRTRT